MTTPAASRRKTLSIAAIALGVTAVALGAASFVVDDAMALRMVALVLMVLGLAVGRHARTARPPVDTG